MVILTLNNNTFYKQWSPKSPNHPTKLIEEEINWRKKVTCHLSSMPTETATHTPPANSPTIRGRLVHQAKTNPHLDFNVHKISVFIHYPLHWFLPSALIHHNQCTHEKPHICQGRCDRSSDVYWVFPNLQECRCECFWITQFLQ